jgi:ACS family glucarate transporter-like MFS transporter
MLTDRWGAGVVMGAGMVVWAIGSAATGAAVGLSTLIAARLLLGAGESSSYPAGNRIVREWAPRSERGLMVSLFTAGAGIGPAAGFLVSGYLLSRFDWRTMFYIVGAGTFVWALVWIALYRSPERAPWLGKEERAFIFANRDATSEGPVQAMSLSALLRQPVMWGLMIPHGCQTYTSYLFLSWLPSYLRTVRHLDLFSAGWLSMLPYVCLAIGMLLLGSLSDALHKGRDLSRGARRYLMIVCMLVASCVIFIPFAENLVLMEILVIGSIVFVTVANTLNYALAGDLIVDRSSAGTVFGLQVLGGNSFGFIAPMLTGFIIAETQEYTLSFVLAGVLTIIGVVVSLVFVRRPLQPAFRAARTA